LNKLNSPATESLKQFWDRCHASSKPTDRWWLSNYSGPQIWDFLKIRHLIKPGIRVLTVGVGTGRGIHDLHDQGCECYALDISELPMSKLTSILVDVYLASKLDRIPSNHFDLIISHLVIQHMLNSDFGEQTHHLVRSLKPGGTYAFQIAARANGQCDRDVDISMEALKSGAVCRTPEYIASFLPYKISLFNTIEHAEYKSRWHALHIKKGE